MAHYELNPDTCTNATCRVAKDGTLKEMLARGRGFTLLNRPCEWCGTVWTREKVLGDTSRDADTANRSEAL